MASWFKRIFGSLFGGDENVYPEQEKGGSEEAAQEKKDKKEKKSEDKSSGEEKEKKPEDKDSKEKKEKKSGDKKEKKSENSDPGNKKEKSPDESNGGESLISEKPDKEKPAADASADAETVVDDEKHVAGEVTESAEDTVIGEAEAAEDTDAQDDAEAEDDAADEEAKEEKDSFFRPAPADYVIENNGERGRGTIMNTCYDNRELSWLKFNTRVLEEAEDTTNPFCERLSFASIYQSNLDEFFMVRIGSLYDQMLVSSELRDNKTNMTCQEQILAVFDEVKVLSQRKDACYADLKKGLEDYGVEILGYADLEKAEQEYLDAYFEREVRPLLSPQIIGKKQPFPFIKNKSIYAVVVIEKKGRVKLGLVPCSGDIFPRLVKIPGHPNRYILIEELILHYIHLVFDRYSIKSKSLIRIIRNADIDPDEEMYDDDTDFRQVMEQLISTRRKLCPIKLEYTRLMDEEVIDTLCSYLDLKKKHVFHSEAPLDLSFFSQISDILRNQKELFYDKFAPQYPQGIDRERSIMDQVREKDRLLFYPYDSIEPFLGLLNEAAENPEVVSIKMTLYRVANDSKVVEALIKAAENGKEVVALVELRARFDEENNIGWSRRLEDAGCRILYGLDRLKVHSKLCLITEKENDGIKYITQIGTGNYNEKTAKLYTDFALMTANQDIGKEANIAFQRLCMGQTVEETTHLMIAPKCLRNKILYKIDMQIEKAKCGQKAYVGAKMNSLTDKVIIEKLIEASQAGVEVELIVRGSCCLVAGVPGYTENVTVRSIVGRYLEHSRIYIFGSDDIFISSADFMTRNTTKRVEVAAPVYDEDLKRRILHIFDVLMSDNVKARVQQPDGNYMRAELDAENPINAQEMFQTEENR